MSERKAICVICGKGLPSEGVIRKDKLTGNANASQGDGRCRDRSMAKVRRLVKAKPDQDGRWWVVIVPGDQTLAGPRLRRDAVYVKNAIQEVLGRER